MKLLVNNIADKKIAIEILKQGGVIAHPTDTCFGFAACILKKQAVEKIQKIKQMSSSKPISIALASVECIEDYCEVSRLAQLCIDNFLPGPLTLLLPKKSTFPQSYFPETEYVGVRVPNDEITHFLTQELGLPITTTSVNITGEKEVYSGKDASEIFKNQLFQPDAIFDIDISKDSSRKPSTIVKIDGNSYEIIRQGALKIQSFLKSNC